MNKGITADNRMIVCSTCLMAIESHEGSKFTKAVSWEDIPESNLIEDENGIESVRCDWCDELFGTSEMREMLV